MTFKKLKITLHTILSFNQLDFGTLLSFLTKINLIKYAMLVNFRTFDGLQNIEMLNLPPFIYDYNDINMST